MMDKKCILPDPVIIDMSLIPTAHSKPHGPTVLLYTVSNQS